MAEPTILYSPDGETVVVVAPSEVRRMEAAGWSRTPPAARQAPPPETKKPAAKGKGN